MNELLVGDIAKFGGRFQVDCWRRIAPGDIVLPDDVLEMIFSKRSQRLELRRRVWSEDIHNILTDQGLNSILNVYFDAATQITTWYCVMFENDFTPDGDETYAVPGYTETTAYDETPRPEYVEAASTAKSITNSANKAAFTISATKTLYGAALVGGGSAATTKGNTAGGGTLACAARFTASRGVQDNDVVNLTYTVGAVDDGV